MATVKYLSITELQPPYDSGVLDGANRAMWIFNVLARKVPSATFQQELVAILLTAGVHTAFNTDLFASSKAVLPSGPGPFTNIVATGGITGIRRHNRVGSSIDQPTAQIVTHALDPVAAEGKSREAYAALMAIVNQTVTV